jgi:hypothetical protein
MGEVNPSFGGSPIPRTLKGKESPGQRPICPSISVDGSSDASSARCLVHRPARHTLALASLPVGLRPRPHHDASALRLASLSRGRPGTSVSCLPRTAQRRSPSGPLPAGSSGPSAFPLCAAHVRARVERRRLVPASSEEGRGSLGDTRASGVRRRYRLGRFGVRVRRRLRSRPAPVRISVRAGAAAVLRTAQTDPAASRLGHGCVGRHPAARRRGAAADLPGGLSVHSPSGGRSRAIKPSGAMAPWARPGGASRVARLRLHAPGAVRGFGRSRTRHGTVIERLGRVG